MQQDTLRVQCIHTHALDCTSARVHALHLITLATLESLAAPAFSPLHAITRAHLPLKLLTRDPIHPRLSPHP